MCNLALTYYQHLQGGGGLEEGAEGGGEDGGEAGAANLRVILTNYIKPPFLFINACFCLDVNL